MKPELFFVLDNIRSSHNVGSLFRTAECLGVSKLYLCGITPAPIDRFGRARADIAKVALGGEQLVKWSSVSETIDCVTSLQGRNVFVCGVERTDEARVLSKVNWSGYQKVALVLGNEVNGLSEDILNNVDAAVQLLQFGDKESFNVSVAGALAAGWIRYQTFGSIKE